MGRSGPVPAAGGRSAHSAASERDRYRACPSRSLGGHAARGRPDPHCGGVASHIR